MKPTNELRFVERFVPSTMYGENIATRARILQQKWARFNQNIIVEHEWRDVPTVKEDL